MVPTPFHRNARLAACPTITAPSGVTAFADACGAPARYPRFCIPSAAVQRNPPVPIEVVEEPTTTEPSALHASACEPPVKYSIPRFWLPAARFHRRARFPEPVTQYPTTAFPSALSP